MTNDEIDLLIKAKKSIIDKPSTLFKIEDSQKRNGFTAESVNGDRFKIFIRQSIAFLENFSIGLLYFDQNGTKHLLLRVNGNHGEVVKNNLNPDPHRDYHIHRLTSEDISSGRHLHPTNVIITDKYTTFEQALAYFLFYVNISDVDNYFKNLKQLDLFEDEK